MIQRFFIQRFFICLWACCLVAMMLPSHGSGPRFESGQAHFLNLKLSRQKIRAFHRFLNEKKYSQAHIKLCKNAIKSVYKNSSVNLDLSTKYMGWQCKGIRVFCNFLAYKNLYPQEIGLIRKHVKIIRSGIDSYVPTDQQSRPKGRGMLAI